MRSPIVDTETTYSSERCEATANRLVREYKYIKKETIGKSIAGKNIFALSIGDGEKELFVNAAHHADDGLTVPLILRFINDYAQAVRTETALAGYNARALFARTRLVAVPLVNPDGLDLVGGFFHGILKDNAELIAEHYPDIPFPSGWTANILGTDLNLNYPAEWKSARSFKYAAGYVSPAPREFVGFYPLSAAESRCIRDFTVRHHFRMVIAYQTRGNLIYHTFMNYNPAGAQEVLNALTRASGYAPAIPRAAFASAGYKDWFIQKYNRPGFTVKCGDGAGPLPASGFDDVYAPNLSLLAAALACTAKLL